MECGVVGEHHETPCSHHQHRHLPPRRGPIKNSVVPALIVSTRVSDVSAPVYTNCVWLLPLTTAKANRLARTFLVITRQRLQLERCSNPLHGFSKSSSSESKTKFQFWVWDSLGGRHKWGCFRVFMVCFTRPWTPIEWAHILAKIFLRN